MNSPDSRPRGRGRGRKELTSSERVANWVNQREAKRLNQERWAKRSHSDQTTGEWSARKSPEFGDSSETEQTGDKSHENARSKPKKSEVPLYVPPSLRNKKASSPYPDGRGDADKNQSPKLVEHMRHSPPDNRVCEPTNCGSSVSLSPLPCGQDEPKKPRGRGRGRRKPEMERYVPRALRATRGDGSKTDSSVPKVSDRNVTSGGSGESVTCETQKMSQLAERDSVQSVIEEQTMSVLKGTEASCDVDGSFEKEIMVFDEKNSSNLRQFEDAFEDRMSASPDVYSERQSSSTPQEVLCTSETSASGDRSKTSDKSSCSLTFEFFDPAVIAFMPSSEGVVDNQEKMEDSPSPDVPKHPENKSVNKRSTDGGVQEYVIENSVSSFTQNHNNSFNSNNNPNSGQSNYQSMPVQRKLYTDSWTNPLKNKINSTTGDIKDETKMFQKEASFPQQLETTNTPVCPVGYMLSNPVPEQKIHLESGGCDESNNSAHETVDSEHSVHGGFSSCEKNSFSSDCDKERFGSPCLSSLSADSGFPNSAHLVDAPHITSDSDLAMKETPMKSDSNIVYNVSASAITVEDCGTNSIEVDDDDDDTWDNLFDDNGDCLDDSMIKELTDFVGKVDIDKPKINYLKYEPKEPEINCEAFNHIVEIYDFSSDLATCDLVAAFKDFSSRGFDVKWVDDTHALGVFSSSVAANEALRMMHPLMKLRPMSEASRKGLNKARQCQEFLQPYKARPETSSHAARRLVAGALGMAPKVPREVREQERKKLKEAKEKRRQERQQKVDIWDGSFGSCAMDREETSQR